MFIASALANFSPCAKYGQKAVRTPYRVHTEIVAASACDVTTTQSSKSDWLTRMVCSRKSA